jgi:choline dehydrogenase-like flavoprotein
MLTDIADHPEGATLQGDAVVIGSGIAGAEVAVSLARAGRRVILLESGRSDFDARIQALNDIVFLGKRHRALDPDTYYHRYLPAHLRGVSRLRQLGGTSNVWTGKWKHLQRSDFGGRDWLPASDWPITLEDLLPHYREAAADYGFGNLEAEARRPEVASLRGTLAPHGLKITSFYWEAEPTRTAKRFAEEFRTWPNLLVVTGATATELRLDESGQRVTAVACRSLEGRSLTAEGDTFVLATGALETPRLLLASRSRDPRGICNAHDLVGRFYADHPKHHTGDLVPGPLTRRFARELQYGPKPRFCICFALDDATQRARHLLEHVIYLKPIYAKGPRPLARLLGRARAEDANGPVATYRVKFVTEQVPNPESRVRLLPEADPLGMPKLALDWRLTPADEASLAQTLALATERFAASGLGAFRFGDDPPRLDTMTDAAHQMGTTRMSTDPASGVVDTDCRVFGTTNLYVAGSAVFPTCPSYSPTFTILALARRLARHLLARPAARPAASARIATG